MSRQTTRGFTLIELALVIFISASLLLAGLYVIQHVRVRLQLVKSRIAINQLVYAMVDYYNSDCNPAQSPVLADTSISKLYQNGFLTKRIYQRLQDLKKEFVFTLGMQSTKQINLVYVQVKVKQKKELQYFANQLDAQKVDKAAQTLTWYKLPSLMRDKFNGLGQYRFKKTFSPGGVCKP